MKHSTCDFCNWFRRRELYAIMNSIHGNRIVQRTRYTPYSRVHKFAKTVSDHIGYLLRTNKHRNARKITLKLLGHSGSKSYVEIQSSTNSSLMHERIFRESWIDEYHICFWPTDTKLSHLNCIYDFFQFFMSISRRMDNSFALTISSDLSPIASVDSSGQN